MTICGDDHFTIASLVGKWLQAKALFCPSNRWQAVGKDGTQAYMAVGVEGVELVGEDVQVLCEPVGGQILQHVLQSLRESATAKSQLSHAAILICKHSFTANLLFPFKHASIIASRFDKHKH